MVNLGAADRVNGRAIRRSPLKQLYVQVLIAIGAGILLGHFYPSLAVDMKPLSDGFITLIRAVVPPIKRKGKIGKIKKEKIRGQI